MTRQTVEHIYVHVPFCLRKCGYCSFYSRPVCDNDRRRYLATLHRELDLYARAFDLAPRTIYMGGGTPSLLRPREIDDILTYFDLGECEEITLEANPATLDANYAAALAATPVNRVSLGAQSFVDDELCWLGRLHNAARIEESFHALRRAGFGNLSLDFIYGLPSQTPASLEHSLAAIDALRPEHVSLYCLSLDEDAPLFAQRRALPDDDAVADLYGHIVARLPEMGFEAYEISNFARSGCASRHNLGYWSGAAYIGLGPAAAGNLAEGRYANPADLDEWQEGVEQGCVAPGLEPLSPADRMSEAMFLGLRRTAGVCLAGFEKRFETSVDDVWGDDIARLVKLGFLEQMGGVLRLTRQAWFVSNEILQVFV